MLDHDMTTLEVSLGIEFKNKDLIQQAFIHRSYLNEHPEVPLGHNERLEYLGDAVLELVTTHYLFTNYPDTPEGNLTAYRAALVRTESISDAAARLNFSEYLYLSKGEAKDTNPRARAYILANTFEAFVGALYLDQGYEAAKSFISEHLLHTIKDILEKGLWKDAKSWVQEKAQEILSVTPSYKVLKEEGPDHDKMFTVAIFFGDEQVAIGEGKSKQDAQQSAARLALDKKEWSAV